MNSKNLPTGYLIHNYRIDEILGVGGFGITYKAFDLNLNRLVALKEYMPESIAARTSVGDVEPINADYEKNYQDGLKSYVKEAQALARFKHDNIVKVYTFFRHHKTAYIIMEYVEGMTFSDWLIQHPTPSETELIALTVPILSGLHELHKVKLLHRDIKPNNIYICHDNTPILLDFGTVGNLMPTDGTKKLSAIKLTEGFAPPEQYGRSGQGPWTDVYSVGACLHLAVTGRMVTNAMERTSQVFSGNPDPQPNLKNLNLRNNYSDHFLDAIEQAISLNPKDRMDDALSLKNQLININSPQISNVADTVRNNHIDDKEFLSTYREQNGVDAETLNKNIFLDRDDSALQKTANLVYPEMDKADSSPDHTTAPEKRSQSTSPGINTWLKPSRSGKIYMVMAAVAGFFLLVSAVKTMMGNEQLLDTASIAMNTKIDQMIDIIEEMNLPKTGSYAVAFSSWQFAMDIESKKVDGTLVQINENLTKAETGFKKHILTTGSIQITNLLIMVTEKIEKTKQLGVQNVSILDLSEFTKPPTNTESVQNRYRILLNFSTELDSNLKKKARKYVIGSSPQEIQDALEMCRQFSNNCARDWYADERAREFILSPFELDKSEATLGEFSEYVDSLGIETMAQKRGFSYKIDLGKDFSVVRANGLYWKNGYNLLEDTENQPIIHVSRADAQGYCNFVGKRLPTEAEWESVARGPHRFKYPSGDTWDASKVNWGGGLNTMLPVNSFQPNDLDFFDLAGSVTEWTSSDATEENTGVLKGGSRFDTNVANFRLSVRRLENINYTGEDVGFRCAKTVDQWPDELIK